MKRPAARSEVILDGVFADAVTIVEADGDRVAYQTAFELGHDQLLAITISRQLAALGNGGDGSLYRSLHIPVAVIADLDLILDPPGLGRIIKALASDARAPELTEKCDGLIRDIRRIPPDLTEMEISRRIGDSREAV